MTVSEVLTICEVVATVLGVLSVYLLSVGDGRGWTPGAVCIVLMGTVYWGRELYGSALLQLYFLPAQYVGWRRWRSGLEKDLRLSSRYLSWPARFAVVGALALGWLGAAALLRSAGGSAHLIDAFATAGSVAAQTLMVLGFRECWLLWLLVDTVYIGLMVHQNLWAFAALYLLFCGLALNGWREWTRES